MIKVKRVYEAPRRQDGFRILVDRLWPRGLAKEKSAVHLWLRDIAPSGALRKWFSHRPERWTGFQKRYEKELVPKRKLLGQLRQAERKRGTVTLLFAAKDQKRNNAVALRAILAKERGRARHLSIRSA